MDPRFEISETKKFGVYLKIYDSELADEFDDFINGDCYVLSEIKFESDGVHFYFGQASSVEKVSDLVKKFLSK